MSSLALRDSSRRHNPSRKSERGGWRRVRLGEVLRRHNEIIHPGDRPSGEARFVGLEHIEAGSGRRIGSSTIDFATMTGRKPTFRSGQIVYGYLRPYLNKVWLAEFDGCSSVDQFAFEVDRGFARPDYVAAFMRSETFLQRAAIVTTTGQLPRIGVDEIAAVEIDLPPLAEQERIATRLTAAMAEVEQARAAAQARLAAAEALPASFVRLLFENPDARKWPLSPLRELLEENGQYGTSVRSNKDERGLPILGMPHIRSGRIRWENVAHAELSEEDVKKYRLRVGDILFNRTNSAELVGKTAIFDGFRDACFASYLIRFRARRDRVEPAFICVYINSGPGRAFVQRHMARAVGQVNISASTMHRMPIPCPSLEVQREILEAVDSRSIETNTIVELCHHELAGIDALPAALLREAFGSTEDDDGEAV